MEGIGLHLQNVLVLPVDDEENISVSSEDEAPPKARQLIVELSSDSSKPSIAKKV